MAAISRQPPLFVLLREQGLALTIKWAAQDQREIDLVAFHITNNVRDIIVENAIQNKLPPALCVDIINGCYVLTIKK